MTKQIKKENIYKKIQSLQTKIEELRSELDEIIPYAIIKETAAFGNSSHVVLSKDLIDKRVGVFVLGSGEVKK